MDSKLMCSLNAWINKLPDRYDNKTVILNGDGSFGSIDEWVLVPATQDKQGIILSASDSRAIAFCQKICKVIENPIKKVVQSFGQDVSYQQKITSLNEFSEQLKFGNISCGQLKKYLNVYNEMTMNEDLMSIESGLLNLSKSNSQQAFGNKNSDQTVSAKKAVSYGVNSGSSKSLVSKPPTPYHHEQKREHQQINFAEGSASSPSNLSGIITDVRFDWQQFYKKLLSVNDKFKKFTPDLFKEVMTARNLDKKILEGAFNGKKIDVSRVFFECGKYENDKKKTFQTSTSTREVTEKALTVLKNTEHSPKPPASSMSDRRNSLVSYGAQLNRGTLTKNRHAFTPVWPDSALKPASVSAQVPPAVRPKIRNGVTEKTTDKPNRTESVQNGVRLNGHKISGVNGSSSRGEAMLPLEVEVSELSGFLEASTPVLLASEDEPPLKVTEPRGDVGRSLNPSVAAMAVTDNKSLSSSQHKLLTGIIHQMRANKCPENVIKDLPEVFKSLALDGNTVRKAAIGEIDYLNKIFEVYSSFRREHPQTPLEPIKQNQAAADVRHLAKSEDVIDGLAYMTKMAGQLPYAGQRSGVYDNPMNLLLNLSDDVLAGGVDAMSATPYKKDPKIDRRSPQSGQKMDFAAVRQQLGMDHLSASLKQDVAGAYKPGKAEPLAVSTYHHQGSVPQSSNGITEQQINSILDEMKKTYPDEMAGSSIDVINKHIRFIELDWEKINNATHGGRDSLEIIMANCLIRDQSISEKSIDTPGMTESLMLDIEKVNALEKSTQKAPRFHSHGNVVLRRHSGIQASNNNCCLASFFMAASHSGVMSVLIRDAKDRNDKLMKRGNVKDQADSLGKLISILERFNVKERNSYLPNNGLDDIRGHYQLREGELGLAVEVNELLSPIMNEIYGYQEVRFSDKEPLDASRSSASLRNSVSLIQVPNSWKPVSNEVLTSTNMDELIEMEMLPNGLKMNKIDRRMSPWIKDTLLSKTEFFSDPKGLGVNKTTEFDYKTGNPVLITFEYFDENRNLIKKVIVSKDKTYQGREIIRSKETIEFDYKLNQASRCEERMKGYSTYEKFSGEIEVTKSIKIDSLQGFINNCIDSFSTEYAERTHEVLPDLLPDRDHCPEFLLVQTPIHDKNDRQYIDLKRDEVSIPMLNRGNVSYELSAVMSIDTGHYVSWNFQDGWRGGILYSDSMGDVHDDVTIPLVVSMPAHGTKKALDDAHMASNTVEGSYGTVAKRFSELNEKTSLVILKRKK